MPTFESPVEWPYQPESTGDRIQHARRLLGVFLGWDITQTQLADFLELPVATVIGLEGDSVSAEPLIDSLCAALGVRPDYLMFGREPIAEAMSASSRARWRFVLNGMGGAPVVASRGVEARSSLPT